MSADNWRECPACLKRRTIERETKLKRAGQSYGKVPPEEYIRLVEEAGRAVESKDTLREDYELGIEPTGEFWVSYSGRCTTCGWSHRFKHKEQLSVDTKENRPC